MGGPALLVIDIPHEAERAAEKTLDKAIELLADLESRYSRYQPKSLISKINNCAGSGRFTELDTATKALFDLAGQLWRESGGVFDITSGPLRHAWCFQVGAHAAPDRISHLLDSVGYDLIEWRENSCHLSKAGMEVDLGGIAKEFAVDSVADFLRNEGITSGLIELAGDISVIGKQGDGSPWKIGIQDPGSPSSVCTVNLADAALATSGNYARTVTHNGKRYGHLLDPRSGWPVEGPDSVSVIDTHCLTAGAVATVACLKNQSSALDWLSESDLPWLLCNIDEQPIGPIAKSFLAAN